MQWSGTLTTRSPFRCDESGQVVLLKDGVFARSGHRASWVHEHREALHQGTVQLESLLQLL